MSNRHRKHLPLIGLILFHLFFNLLWLSLDKTPPAWDQAAHIRSAVMAGRWISGEQKISFVQLIKNFYAYPPLIYFFGGVWGLLAGLGIDQISFVNTFSLILAIIGIYKIAEKIWGEKEALISAIIFSFMPVIYDISRGFLLDLPLTAIVIWGIWFWLKSGYLRKRKYSWGWWLMLILASLTKLNGFIYFAPMGIIALIYWFKNPNPKQLKKLILGGVFWILLVGWWWIINWDNVYYNIAVANKEGEALTDPMNLVNWQTWIHYFRLFFQHQVQPIPGFVFIACLFQWVKRWKKEKFSEAEKSLTWWLLSLYIIFTIIKNKDFRYTMPLLSVIAIIMAVQIIRMKKIHRRIIISLLAVFWAVIYINNSFGWPVKNWVLSGKTFLLGDIEWLGLDDYPVRPARNTVWPNGQIVKELYRLGMIRRKRKCLAVVNWAEVNDNNLILERDLFSVNGSQFFELRSIGLITEFADDQEIESFIGNFDLALVLQQDAEPAPFYAKNLRALQQLGDWVWQHPKQWKLEKEFNIPDKTKVFLFTRT